MRSSNRIHDAFDSVTASEELKSRTKVYLQAARQQEGKQSERSHARTLPVRLAYGALGIMLALLLGVGGYTFLLIPVSYVSIDVNPSIELTLNRLDRVIAAEAYNEDGRYILDAVAVGGLYYTEAIERMVESEAMQPYLSENAGLTFTVAADSGQRESALLSGIETTSGCREHGGVGYGTDISAVQEAHENGLSLGKYAAYRILSHYDSSVTAEDCHNMTMSELHGLIEEHEHGQEAHEQEEHGQKEHGQEAHGQEKHGQEEDRQEEYGQEEDRQEEQHGHGHSHG